MPWLTEEPDFESEDGPRALSGILQEQWDRWWCCRKSQWISRGLGDSEAGERAFCEADKSRAMEGEVRWASSPRFNNFSQTRWRLFMPRERLRPLGDDTFATYSNDVRIRVAPYLFKKPMQLKKDPQKQTAWTNWLEYLSYELRSLESWTAAADALESRYQKSTKKLGDALPSLVLEFERFLYGSAFGPPDFQQGFPPASEDSEQTGSGRNPASSECQPRFDSQLPRKNEEIHREAPPRLLSRSSSEVDCQGSTPDGG